MLPNVIQPPTHPQPIQFTSSRLGREINLIRGVEAAVRRLLARAAAYHGQPAVSPGFKGRRTRGARAAGAGRGLGQGRVLLGRALAGALAGGTGAARAARTRHGVLGGGFGAVAVES